MYDNLQNKPIIGVMGSTSCNEEEYGLAERVGELIAQRRGIVLCGGGTGVMEAVCKGAKKAGGITIGIMPGSNRFESPHNQYVDIPIYTGMSDGRNAINAKSSDVVIAISGSYGTLSEIGLALKSGKHVVALNSWQLSSKNTSLQNYYPVNSPEEAVELVFLFLKNKVDL
jgi:uncharacterized protein (TIGR00725 family)